MSTGTRAWSLIAIPGPRQYGGNQGYDDDLTSTYRYDSAVANSLQVSPGDLILLRDRKLLLGIGLVERIASGPGTKKRFRCPECRVTGIKERHTLSPRWRCNNGHTFDDALQEEVTVTHYEAHYRSSFLPADGQISASEIRSAVIRPSTQLSIEELDHGKLEGLLIESFPDSKALFSAFIQSVSVVADDADTKDSAGQIQYTPSFTDNRKCTLRSIRERRGQSSFRKKLIRRYGASCMISRCDVLHVVEAAHIWPYRGLDDNHPDNGLLLRADLHTLFDLDLLGIHPDTLRVSIAKAAKRDDYVRFDGSNLVVRGNRIPSRPALANRWSIFSRRERYGHNSLDRK